MAGFGDFVKKQAGNFVDGAINKALGNIFGNTGGAENGFSVNTIVSALNKSGVAQTSHFEVYVIGGANVGDERDMAMRIDSIDIPGRNFAPIDHKFTNMGPVNRIPGQQFYTDVTATILLSSDMREKDYFEWWQEKMMNTGAYETGVTEQQQQLLDQEEGLTVANQNYSNSPWTHRYFDDYIGTVEIRQYDSNGGLRSIHKLMEAYPLSIAPISMNWGSDEMARLQVTFGYKNYKVVFNKQDQPGMGFGFSFSLGKGGLKLGARLPGIGNISYAKGSGFTGTTAPLQKKIFKHIGL